MTANSPVGAGVRVVRAYQVPLGARVCFDARAYLQLVIGCGPFVDDERTPRCWNLDVLGEGMARPATVISERGQLLRLRA